MSKTKLFNQKQSKDMPTSHGKPLPKGPNYGLIVKVGLIIAIWAIFAFFTAKVVNIFLADVSFARGVSTGSLVDLAQATTINPSEEAYHRNLGLAYAVTAKDQTDVTLKEQLVAAADEEFLTALSLNDHNLLTLKSVINGYEELGNVSAGYLTKVQDLTEKTIKLSPTDPDLWYEAAKIESKLGNKEKAAEYYKKTLELKNSPTDFPPL